MSGVGVRLRGVRLVLGGRVVLGGVNLDLAPGAHCLLLGRSGAGKTELLKLLAGERWPTPTGRERREYRDARGVALGLVALRPRLLLVGGERQDRYVRHAWDFSVERVVGSGCHGLDRPLARLSRPQRQRVRGVLVRLGLWRLRRRRFLTLSYGERRLTLLARALAARPRLLLLDEPYNGLDRGHRRLVSRELARLARTRVTIAVSAHRPEDVPRGFTRALEIERGRIRYDGPLARASARWLTPVRSPGPPRTVRARRGTRAAGDEPLVELRAIDLYRDYRPVIRGLNWTIGGGEHWAVLGANGSGKSTLLGLLHGGLTAADRGELRRRGHPRGAHIEEWQARVALVSPELQAEYPRELGVLELVVSGLRGSFGLDSPPTPAERARARRALARVGLRLEPGRTVAALSYGQRRLALIARALVRAPEALLLDEPLTGLDAPLRARVRRLLAVLARGGVQLVMAVHHPDDLLPEIRRVLRLHAGRGTIHARRL